MNDVNVINISVYSGSYYASVYETIAIFTSSTIDGTYSEITTSATRLTLSSGTEYYQYTHEASSISTNWYKHKFVTSSASLSTFITAPYYGNTSDLTELVRYEIGDTTSGSYRYTIKELRRYVNNALKNLQLTSFKRKYKADKDGIISPAMILSEGDTSLVLLQTLIEIWKSQTTCAIDTNITFADGRGRYTNRTWEALRNSVKDAIKERDSLIAQCNRQSIISVNVTVNTS